MKHPAKYLFLFFLLASVSLLAQKKQEKKKPLKYWEDMTQAEKDVMLKDSTLNKDVVALYNKTYFFGKEEKQDVALMKVLTWDKENNLPLRFYLFNNLISSGDTSLNRLLVEYSTKMIFNQTEFTIKYFHKQKLKKNDFYKKYVPFLAADLDEKNEYGTFKDFINFFILPEKDKTIKQTVDLLFKELEAMGAGKK